MKHPIQPIEKDEAGHLRFKQNAIVRQWLGCLEYTRTT